MGEGLNDAISVMNLNLATNGISDSIDRAFQMAAKKLGGVFCFVNVHTATLAQTDPGLYAAFSESTYLAPDGMPLVWLGKLKGSKKISRVCGPDFSDRLWRDPRAKDFSHAFVGGKPGIAERIILDYGLNGFSLSPPYREFSPESALEDWSRVLEKNAGKSPDFVWVGLGAPKQERWMHAVSKHAGGAVFFGVGAAFDFHSGEIRRAPRWMQKAGLEWFYRLIFEPKRLGPRYLLTNTKFFFLLLRDVFR